MFNCLICRNFFYCILAIRLCHWFLSQLSFGRRFVLTLLIIPSASTKCTGLTSIFLSTPPSVRLWTESYPLWNFWQIFDICNFDFVLFWLGIKYASVLWVINVKNFVLLEMIIKPPARYIAGIKSSKAHKKTNITNVRYWLHSYGLSRWHIGF